MDKMFSTTYKSASLSVITFSFLISILKTASPVFVLKPPPEWGTSAHSGKGKNKIALCRYNYPTQCHKANGLLPLRKTSTQIIPYMDKITSIWMGAFSTYPQAHRDDDSPCAPQFCFIMSSYTILCKFSQGKS